MSSFQNLGVFSSKKPRGAQKPKRVKVDLQNREKEHARNSFGLLTESYCERKTPKYFKDDI